MSESKPVTREMMEAYISTLEKQVQQATLIVTTLEEVNDKLKEINGHFSNGFRSEIMDHVTEKVKDVEAKVDKILGVTFVNKTLLDTAATVEQKINDNAYVMNAEVRGAIGGLKSDISDLQSSIKVDRAINIIGWSGFILGVLSIILKLYGKI